MRKWFKAAVRWVAQNLLWTVLTTKAVLSVITGLALAVWAWLDGLPLWGAILVALAGAGLVVWVWNAFTWRLEQRRFQRQVMAAAAPILKLLHVPNRPLATLNELAQPYIRDRVIRVSDLTQGTAVIAKRTFEECTIVGPAILLQQGTGIIDHCTFEGHVEDLVYELTPERDASRKSGCVAVRSCVFRSCHFSGLGFAGTPEASAKFKASVQQVEL